MAGRRRRGHRSMFSNVSRRRRERHGRRQVVGVPRGVSHGVPEPIAGDVRVRERRVYLGRGGDAEGRGRAGESGTQGEVRQGRFARCD